MRTPETVLRVPDDADASSAVWLDGAPQIPPTSASYFHLCSPSHMFISSAAADVHKVCRGGLPGGQFTGAFLQIKNLSSVS